MTPITIWTASSEFGTYRLCEQRRFRRACASAQSRQNLHCSLIQAGSQEEPSDRKPDPWPLWMTGHAQLKFVMMKCSKTQTRLMGLIWFSRQKSHFHPCPEWVGQFRMSIISASLSEIHECIIVEIQTTWSMAISRGQTAKFSLLFDLNWAASFQKQQNDCAPSEDSDQPGHQPSLIRRS